ncbi:MAG TPA: protein kinase [Anaerolineales bacterium]|nr:protein kinase [Anaerolineales bacterium]
MADWAGKTLGKVHINDLIARGGMAEVYTGTHESFGRVAVKVMRGLLERDSDQLARFRREAEVIENLRHQNIVQMLEYAVVDESPYLVMEYIPGPSLASYLKKLHDDKQRLPIGMAAQILQSMASALDYAHLKGIVHRDIKPANVLLRSQSEVVELGKPLPADVEPILTDFGLVRLLDSTMHTTAGSVSGTPAYMSPEQARGEKVDKRTDIYALGIMLYEMLAGVVPFQADTTFGMLMKHINEPPPPIQGVSPELQMVINRALAKNPKHRYETAGELANDFMALFNGQTVSPGTLHIAELIRQEAEKEARAKPGSSRPNWLRIGIEIGVAALVLFAIYFAVNTRQQAIAQDVPVGRARFDFTNNDFDTVTFDLNEVPRPQENEHYEVWLVYEDGSFRDIGALRFDANGALRAKEFRDLDGNNLLNGLQEIRITREQNTTSNVTPASTPTVGEVVYSSVFPPQTLEHVRKLDVSFDGGSDQAALIAGLYYYSGSYVEAAVNGDPASDYVGMVEALANEDEATLRKRNEEMINMIVGDQSELYRDYDGDGTEDTFANGYGSLPNGTQAGYFEQTAVVAQAAAEASDTTANIIEQNRNLQICIQNMKEWTDQILPLALQLEKMEFGPEMQPIVDELSRLGLALSKGVDANKNGQVESAEGECGAGQAYDIGRYMADFPIFIGTNRLPPTAIPPTAENN